MRTGYPLGGRRSAPNTRGAALIIAMLVMGVLLMLGTAFMTISSTETQIAFNERNALQAFYLADAAANKAISRLNDKTLDPPYTGETGTALGPGTFNLTMTPTTGDTRMITATGCVPNCASSTAAQSQVVVTVSRTSYTRTPLFGNNGVDVDGGSVTDSYNSNNSSYDPLHPGSKGSIGGNSTLNVKGDKDHSTTVNGDATTSSGKIKVDKDSTITGTQNESGPDIPMDSVDATYKTPNANGGLSNPPYDASTKAFSAGTGANVVLPAGTYYFSSFSVTGGAVVSTSGNVKIYVTGAFTVSGGSKLNAGSLNPPGNLQLYSSATGNAITVDGSGTDVRGYFYNSTGTMSITNGATLYGAATAKQLNLGSNGSPAKFHYDEAVSNLLVTTTPFKIVAGTWHEVILP